MNEDSYTITKRKTTAPEEIGDRADNALAKFDARWRRRFRAAAVGLVSMTVIGVAPNPTKAAVVTYYYSGTAMSGVVAWDSIIGAANQIILYGGGYAFNTGGSGYLGINSNGQVTGWDLQAFLDPDVGEGFAAITGGDLGPGGHGAGELY